MFVFSISFSLSLRSVEDEEDPSSFEAELALMDEIDAENRMEVDSPETLGQFTYSLSKVCKVYKLKHAANKVTLYLLLH